MRIRSSILLWVLLVACSGCHPQSSIGEGISTEAASTPGPILTQVPTQAAPPEASPPVQKTPLSVFCAGSLIIPFDELEKAFESANPDIDVQNECHGSIQVIRHVTELHERIDVVATADHALIPMLMYTSRDPDTGKAYADWYIRFAGNRLALAYSANSRLAGEISADNWYVTLQQPDVKVGLADPRFDASGYRALMALKLAEKHYQQTHILKNFLDHQFNPPVTFFEEDNTTEISVPEVLEPVSNARIVLRGASIQLIALLESGDLDYAFEYESVIRQHNLELIPLPEEINLGSQAFDDNYRQVRVLLDFQRFASVKPVFAGEAIGYGITIPGNAPHPEAAARFIAFLLGPEGRTVMNANHQPILEQPACYQPKNAPPAVQDLCIP